MSMLENILDQDSARLLVSETLKNRLAASDTDDNDLIELVVAELILSSENEQISFTGQMIDLEFNDKNSNLEIEKINIQFNCTVQDGYELFDLINSKKYSCNECKIIYLEKDTSLQGPFKIFLRKLTNFNYKKNQCILCIELVRI